MIHILTGEYPPVSGGVADYTALVATELSNRGEQVHVWTAGDEGSSVECAVRVHRVALDFGFAGLRCLNRAWKQVPGPRRVIVQWTPHSFGMRSLNLPFALWLWNRARCNDRIELMVHEPFLAFGEGNRRQDTAAFVQRAMIALLLDAASHVRVAIPAWETRLRPWCLRRRTEFEWAPVPSNIPECSDLREVLRVRGALVNPGQTVVGHFGTFRKDVAMLLVPAIEEILESTDALVLLIGRGSEEFARDFLSVNESVNKGFEGRVVASGELEPDQVAIALSACDVLLQPYPDGISTRRGTAMAAMSLGIPLVSNLGHLSESNWRGTPGARITRTSAATELASAVRELLYDRELRASISAQACALYQQHFSLDRTVDSLLQVDAGSAPKLRAA